MSPCPVLLLYILRIVQIYSFKWLCPFNLNDNLSLYCGGRQGGPQPPLPFPSPPLPSPSPPTSFPLEYFSRPHRKKTQLISSDNLSFQCMDYYQSFKTRRQFVCSSVRLLVCFWVLQPSQRPSRQHCGQVKPCPRRKGKDKGRQDIWEKKCKHNKEVPVLL